MADRKKMEGHYSTDQSPQWAVVPMEEEVGNTGDLQLVGVRSWRELVADRKKWKDIVRQTKAHSGL